MAHGQSVRVIALAGTGKTTTLSLAARALPPRPLLYVAFNKSVAEAAKRRFPHWVQPRTAHSLAYAAVGRRYGPRLQASPFALRRVWPRWVDRRLAEVGVDRATGVALVVETLGAFCHSADEELSPRHVSPLAFAQAPEDQRRLGVAAVTDVARFFWRQMMDPQSDCPVTHDVYLKSWQLQHPQLPYAAILLDEAQDADPVILDIVRRQPGQLVVVGDPHQAIYGWRGAHNALARWEGLTLPLTTSWRFGPQVAEAGNAVLERLGSPHRVVGAGPAGSPQGPRAFLARTTMGLLTETLAALQGHEKVSVLGGSEPLAALLEGAHALQQGQPVRHPDLALFPTWSDLVVASQTPAGTEYRPLVSFVLQNARTLPSIVRTLRHDTVEPAQATLTLATAHKAKGQEWTTVDCGTDFAWPRFKEDREEAHLIYVALTRAQHHLRAEALQHTVATGRPISALGHRPPPGARREASARKG